MSGNGEPAVLTELTEDNWSIVLEVYGAVELRRGEFALG